MTTLTHTIGVAERRSITSELPELRAALEEQRSFRQSQLAELAATTTGGSALTLNDAHDEVANALRAGATKALSEIEAAVARIESGSYGTCEICNEQIPLHRLEILPMAALCMRCARTRDLRTVNR